MTDIDFRADPSIDLETPKRLELIDPVTEDAIVDADGKPAFITIYSAQSRLFQERAFKIQARVKQKTRRSQKTELSFEEQLEAEARIYAAALGDEWHICRREAGVWRKIDAPCTPENAVNWILANPLYKRQIASQTDDIEAYLGDGQGNFTSEASSSSTKASKTRSS